MVKGEVILALIKCSECGKEISDRARSCPHCGCPVEGTEELVDKIVVEKEAPEGYELNPDRMYFSITEDGQIIKVNMKDSRIVEVPDTFSIDYHIFEIIGCIAIISGVGMYVYVKKKKK